MLSYPEPSNPVRGGAIFLQVYLCIPRTQLTSVFEGQPSQNKAFFKQNKGRSPFGSRQSSHLPRMMARSRFWSFQPIKLSGPSFFSTSNKVFLRKTCYWKPNPPGFQPNKKKLTTPLFFSPDSVGFNVENQLPPPNFSQFWLAKRKTPNLYHLKTLTW